MTPRLITIAGYFLFLATLGYTSPVPKPNKGFTIYEKIPKKGLTGPAHLARLYSKFRADIPDYLIPALTNTNVVANPEANDASYLCPVNVGGQMLNLDLDTGSADLWVFSTELGSTGAGHTLYDPANSATATLLSGASWNITYADQSFARGNVYLDSVTIDNVTTVKQAVELAEEVSQSFQADTNLDGLLGLAFSSINTVSPKSQLTFFENALQDNILPDKLFTVDLKAGQPGSYDFGFIDKSKYINEITYTSVDNSTGFWEIASTGFNVGNQIVNSQAAQSTPFNAIVDTGTSLLVLDDSLVSSYWSTVPGARYDSTQGGYTFPCSATLPDVEIGIEAATAVVPGSYINFAPITSSE